MTSHPQSASTNANELIALMTARDEMDAASQRIIVAQPAQMTTAASDLDQARLSMRRAIQVLARAAASPSPSGIVTCCVTGGIPGDGGACGDCDPCIMGEPLVPEAVKRLIAEKNSLITRNAELEDTLLNAPQWSGEPVAYIVKDDPELGNYLTWSEAAAKASGFGYTPLYAAPPAPAVPSENCGGGNA